MIKKLILAVFGFFLISYAEEAKFESSDTALPNIKVVYDWNLSSPEEANQALNYISNHIKAYTEYAPLSELKIVVVSHGAEIILFTKQNQEKYKEIIERIKSFNKSYGVEFYICNNTLRALGYDKKDVEPFAIIVPAAVAKLAALQEQGYRLVPAIVHDMKLMREKYGNK